MGDLGKYQGLDCPICGHALQNAVDTAVCPVCGTPHHRACYHELGHCFHESLHAQGYVFTPPELPPEADSPGEHGAGGDHTGHLCPRCHSRSTSDTLFCPYCGFAFGDSRYSPEEQADPDRPPVSPFAAGFTDPLGGVDPTETIEGVAVSDMALFVGPGTHRYLPAFLNLCHKKPRRTAWNWAAFLFPAYWFAFRKMYRQAVVTGIIGLIFPLFMYPALAEMLPVINALPANANSSAVFQALMQKAAADPDFISPLSSLLAFAGMVLLLVFRIVCALYGDWIYMRHAVSRIRAIHDDDEIEDRELYIRAGGSINFFAAFFAMFATYQLTQLLYMLVSI